MREMNSSGNGFRVCGEREKKRRPGSEWMILRKRREEGERKRRVEKEI